MDRGSRHFCSVRVNVSVHRGEEEVGFVAGVHLALEYFENPTNAPIFGSPRKRRVYLLKAILEFWRNLIAPWGTTRCNNGYENRSAATFRFVTP
jgi:hypothetical protein